MFFSLYGFHPVFSNIKPCDELRHGQQKHLSQHRDIGQGQTTLPNAESKVLFPVTTEGLVFILTIAHILANIVWRLVNMGIVCLGTWETALTLSKAQA